MRLVVGTEAAPTIRIGGINADRECGEASLQDAARVTGYKE